MTDNRPIVLDASAAIAFVAREDYGSRIEALLSDSGAADRSIIVPQLFWLEVVNALSGRRKWAGAQVLEAIAELDAFDLNTIDHDRALVLLTIDLVERHGLISYDASYLALAIQQDADLLTLDRQLAAAAGPRSIPLDGGHSLAETGETYERGVTWPDYRGASTFLAKLRADALRGT
jgi:predicted nucleic acid-binding protein